MKTLDDYKVGDKITISHNGIFPRTIQRVMKHYRKKLGLPPVERERNHVMRVVMYNGKKQIFDASENGVAIKDTLERYINNPNCSHFTYIKPLTKEQKDGVNNLCAYFNNKSIPFDRSGLLLQAPYVYFGVWLGKKGKNADDKFYCSEVDAKIDDVLFDYYNGETWNKNIVDSEICKLFKQV